jgi:hypothetical protein
VKQFRVFADGLFYAEDAHDAFIKLSAHFANIGKQFDEDAPDEDVEELFDADSFLRVAPADADVWNDNAKLEDAT